MLATENNCAVIVASECALNSGSYAPSPPHPPTIGSANHNTPQLDLVTSTHARFLGIRPRTARTLRIEACRTSNRILNTALPGPGPFVGWLSSDS
jgi:hypothetical protein